MNKYRTKSGSEDSDDDVFETSLSTTKSKIVIEESDEYTDNEDEDEEELEFVTLNGDAVERSIHRAINTSIANVSIREDYYSDNENKFEEDNEDNEIENVSDKSLEQHPVISETESSASEDDEIENEDDTTENEEEEENNDNDEEVRIESVATPRKPSPRKSQPNHRDEKSLDELVSKKEGQNSKKSELIAIIKKKKDTLDRIKEFFKNGDPHAIESSGQKLQAKAKKLKTELYEYLNLLGSLEKDEEEEEEEEEIQVQAQAKAQAEAAEQTKEREQKNLQSPELLKKLESQQVIEKPTADSVATRISLMADIEKRKREVSKIKKFLNQGMMDALPDKGERLYLTYKLNKENLQQLEAKLTSLGGPVDPEIIDVEKTVKDKIREGYQSEPAYSLFDKNMLKPTPNLATNQLGKRAMETFERQQAMTVDRLQDLHGSIESRPTEDQMADNPKNLKISLMNHQKHALAWLLWRESQKPAGGILADDMGLGKTLTMISLILKSIEQQTTDDDDDDKESMNDSWISTTRKMKYKGGTLVVCPASLINQWSGEIKRHCKTNALTVEIYHGNSRETKAKRLCKNNVVLTTYNLLSRQFKENGILYQVEWNRIILDEGHVIRNYKSQTCEGVCGLIGRKRWVLTGTPIQNKEMDLYSILKFLKVSPFDDIKVWKRWVDNKSPTGIQRLTTLMKSLMLRRTKQELMSKGDLKSLPEKSIELMTFDLDPEERLIYEKVMLYSKTIFAQFLHQRAEKQNMFEMGAAYRKPVNVTDYNTQFNKAQKKLLQHHAGAIQSHEILVLLLRLRQICCHPSLIHAMLDREDLEQGGLEDNVNSTLADGMSKLGLEDDNPLDVSGDIGIDKRVSEDLLTSDNPVFDTDRKSSKLRYILDLVEKIITKSDDKIIIVSQWRSYLEIIGKSLKEIDGATFNYFTGNVAVKDRQDIIDNFNNKNRKPRILLLSLTAGGVGLNLVGGNHLMLVDIHWNPQLESQAQDRIYRFGQTKNVQIYKIICNDTIEEQIKLLQDRKLSIAEDVLTGTGKVNSKLTLNDLKSLFGM